MWLIASEALQKITSGYRRGTVTAQEQLSFVESRGHQDGSRISSIVGGNHEIQVRGILTEEPDFFAQFFGGGNTTYSEIISALATAESDPNIKNISMRFNTPGGHVSGLFKTMEAIASTSKLVTAIVESALSAGFSLASQANKIIAENVASTIGSNGVAMIMRVDEHEIALTNRQSANKIPDLTTEGGKAIIQDFLDDTFDVLSKSIAEGRGVDVETVSKDFGQGRVFLAAEAKKRGMIDSIAQSSHKKTKMKNQGVAKMTLDELKNQHPALFAQVTQIGVTQGVAAEKDRVEAHLTFGALSANHLKVAVAAIQGGDGLTAKIQAQYMTIAAASAEVNIRTEEEGELNGLAPGGGKDDEDIVADLVAKEMGVAV